MSAPTTGQALLEAALAQSGLSLRQFAARYLARDERTARRWRAGTSPIPRVVQWWLREYNSYQSLPPSVLHKTDVWTTARKVVG